MAVWTWIRQHPEFLVLIAVVVVGQVLEKVLRPAVEEPYGASQFPVVPAVVLGLMLLLAIVAVWLRARCGSQVVAAAKTSGVSLPRPASLPSRYVVADPPRQAIGGGLALLDVALVLLIAATLRAPLLAIARHYVPPTWAEVAFVALVLLAVLFVLAKVYRSGGPVLVLILWWGLDRVVPTAGFLATAPVAVATRPRTVVTPPPTPAAEPTVAARQPSQAELAPTVIASQSGEEEPTVVASQTGDQEPTVVAAQHDQDTTVVATDHGEDSERTLVAPQKRDEELEPTVVAPAHDDLDGPTVVTKKQQ